MTDGAASRGPGAGGAHGRGEDEVLAPSHPLELALQFGMRYSGLRDIELDPRLLLYVPLELCEREVILPLSVTDERIEIATAFHDPDVALVRERFPALDIGLVIAPIDRIDELHREL